VIVMVGRREEILDAAIAVLGEQGIRRLTHRDIDAAAGLPSGSTSNYFRTRDALIHGVVEQFAARERAAWEQIATHVDPTTTAELAAALTLFLRDATGPGRPLTLARLAIFVEAGLRPGLQDQLAGSAAEIRRWGARWLRGVGSARPEADAQVVLDLLDGVILHQIAFPDPAFDPSARLTALIDLLVGAQLTGAARADDRRQRDPRDHDNWISDAPPTPN
jgi:DNA-binding transcriptional regulator YbjK